MDSNQLAIIVAFYLSKFDKEAKTRLGYLTDSEAFNSISEVLGVKPNYIKFRRDEFDPIHPWRKGWRRPMDYRIMRAIEALRDLSENELGEIVEKILSDAEYREGEEVNRITRLFSKDNKDDRKAQAAYILRGPTGKKAEEYFIKYHSEGRHSFEGRLIDTREMGCGYDFEIAGKHSLYIEVKGLAKADGGILFTSKEWQTAEKHADNYVLVVIRDLDQDPKIEFIRNPTSVLKAKKSIVTSVQVQYSVSSKEFVK